MVNIEAARAICEMKNVSPQSLTKAISGKISPGSFEVFILISFMCSSPTVSKLSEGDAQVCCYSYTGYVGTNTARKRGILQCRDGTLDF